MANPSLYIPLVGAVFVLLGIVVARSTARDVATLNALQKRRDAEIAAVNRYADAAIEAVHAVQFYIWWAPPEYLELHKLTHEQWEKAEPVLRPLEESLNRVRFLGSTLPPGELRLLHKRFYEILRSVARAQEQKENAKEVWDAVVGAEDIMTKTIEAAHRAAGDLLETYPVEVPDSIASRLRSVLVKS